MLVFLKGRIERDTGAYNALHKIIKSHVQMQNNAMFRFICLRIGHALLKFRFTAGFKTHILWRAVRFDQDVELVVTGRLIVEISLGGPSAAGRTICSNFT